MSLSDRQENCAHHRDKTEAELPPQGWDYAIAEANRQIEEAEGRISELRLSINSFEDFKRRGELWPGTTPSEEPTGIVNNTIKRDSGEASV